VTSRQRRLPLGLDLGSTRVRLASAHCNAAGEFSLAAVATRDLPDDAVTPEAIAEPDLVAAIVEDLRHELGSKERRCVLSLNAQAAVLRGVRFPNMSTMERRQAARFEADCLAFWDTQQIRSIVRVARSTNEPDLHVVGVARDDSLTGRTACARRAGLRPVGVDHEAYALRRAFPLCDAVLDLGHAAATLHTYASGAPISTRLVGGGAQITRAIGVDLSIDLSAAEKRKRLLGTAGAGESALHAFGASLNSTLVKLRERCRVRRIALVGNGARLPGLRDLLEAATATAVEVAPSELLETAAYSEDVRRAAAPDWTLAVALAAWGKC
jgi:Tfp pilus assembly PilM family ATPase